MTRLKKDEILNQLSDWQQDIFENIECEDIVSIAIASAKYMGLSGGAIWANLDNLTLVEIAAIQSIVSERLRMEQDILGVPEIFDEEDDDIE